MTEYPAVDSDIDFTEYEENLSSITEQPAAVHYVDNDEMLAAYIAFQEKREEQKKKGLPEPEIPRYLCDCMMSICTRTAFKHNFINYSFRDEMILDAIEDCIAGINMFDVTRKYIFSYYTTVAFNAFRRRIKLEEKQARVKGRMIVETDIDTLTVQEHDNGEFQLDLAMYLKEASEYLNAHEKHKKSLTSDQDDDVEDEEDENVLVFE